MHKSFFFPHSHKHRTEKLEKKMYHQKKKKKKIFPLALLMIVTSVSADKVHHELELLIEVKHVNLK